MTLPGCHEPWQPWPPPVGQKTEILIEEIGADDEPFPVAIRRADKGDGWVYEATSIPLVGEPERWRPLVAEAPSPWAAAHKASAERCRALLDELRVRVGLIERCAPTAGTVDQMEKLADRLSTQDADDAEPWRYLAVLGEEIATQDGATRGANAEHGTADPVYMATQIERVYGIDPGHADPDGYWVIDGDIEDGEHWTPQRYHECDSDGLDVVPYVERRAFVEGAVSLTKSGIEAYVDRHAHNLDRPEIYIASLCYMPSMIKLRRALIDLCEAESPLEATVGIHLELDGVIRVLEKIREKAATES